MSEREKQTLRLLLAGHEAKSIARELGLSVHTINERLRDARRKLGASSSREAARRLAEAERPAPDSLGDKPIGGVPAPGADQDGPSARRRGGGLAWLAGGLIFMSLIVAAFVLSSVLNGDPPVAGGQAPLTRVAARSAPEAEAQAAALGWLKLLDQQQWAESWTQAGAQFKTHLAQADWSANIRSSRQGLGPATSRTLQSVTQATSLPGAPAGDYRVFQFRTAFAQKAGAVETVTLSHEAGVWRVVGYFINPDVDPIIPDAARQWVQLLDAQNWDASWTQSGTIFKTGGTAARWTAQAQAARQPLGAVSSRTVMGVSKLASLPGAPAGDYQIVQFKTDFANKAGATERVTLAREGTGWKVIGYFIL